MNYEIFQTNCYPLEEKQLDVDDEFVIWSYDFRDAVKVVMIARRKANEMSW